MVDWSSVKKGVQLLKISGGTVQVVARWPDKDFGLGATFEWFLRQVSSRFPAEHLVVSGWDHGYGWRYFSHDFTSGHRITMPQLRAAIVGAGVPIDVLAFDACNMADVEVAYEMALTGRVSYMVGSEETIDSDGFPYDGMLAPLLADPARTPEQVVNDMLAGWQRYYDPVRCFNLNNLSAIDLAKILQGRADLRAWIARLRTDLPLYRARYAVALRHSIYAYDSWHVDLADVASRLAADTGIDDVELKTLSSTVAATARGAVVGVTNPAYSRRFTGMTLWWGTGSDWREYRDAYGRQVAFGKDLGWASFLRAYNAGVRGPTNAPFPLLGRTTCSLTDIAFADAAHGWATGYDEIANLAVILRTTDGGKHWRTYRPDWLYSYTTSSLAVVDGRRVWAVDSAAYTPSTDGCDGSAILRTSDRGAHWSSRMRGAPKYLSGVDFVTPRNGWITGVDDTLLHTTDGGAHWTSAGTPSNCDLWSVDFIDGGHGWVVGGDAALMQGAIRHTDDGVTWVTQKTVTGSVIYGLDALDGSRAWAVGGDPVAGTGVILHTGDGGTTWDVQYGAADAPWLSDVTFIDGSTGWAVGARGTVLRTIDGGTSWQAVDLGTTADLTAVSFPTSQDGWIVGDTDRLYHTSDGGATWELVRADVVGPTTSAPEPAKVRRGATAVLQYRVSDAISPTAAVAIRIVRSGTVVKTLALGTQTTGVTHVARFVCRLVRGTYRFRVSARDEAGNAQSRRGSNTLTVR